MKMKINVVSRKLIKPTTPTPQNLNPYKISFTDEFCPPMNVRVLLFYNSASNQIPNLEESLAQILSKFYPLAGRFFQKDHVVDCSDQGAEFIEAESADVESMDLVREMEADRLNHLLPRNFYQLHETATCPLLSIQSTHFRCGGMAIGICVSHRIFDGSSLETFVSAWSEYCSGDGGGIAIIPRFDTPSLFPRGDFDCTSSTDKSEMWNISICAKRFLFTNEAIARLRCKLREEIGGDRDLVISRVRAVCAVIAKALIGVDRARHGRWRPCLAVQAFDMRKRTAPPLPKHTRGNLAAMSITRSMSAAEAENASAGRLVGLLGEAIEKTTSGCSRILLSGGGDGLNEVYVGPAVEAFRQASSGEVNVMFFSDWSKFGFCKTDLGWGKPAWASMGPVDGENIAVLMECEEDAGIEAWLHLKSNHMPYLQEDQGIRSFAKLM